MFFMNIYIYIYFFFVIDDDDEWYLSCEMIIFQLMMRNFNKT